MAVLFSPAVVAYNGYDSGLGNRIRVTMAAANLAEAEGRAFYYVWPTGKLFGPRFDDLWSWRRGRVMHRATSRLLARRYPYVNERLDWLTEDKRKERLWQIRTGSPIVLPEGVRPWRDDFRRLEAAPAIQRLVRDFYSANLAGRPYVGVMVRAHSVAHEKTKQASPVSWYVDRMHALMAADPGVRFFISCDVPAVKRTLIETIPGAVGVVQETSYNSTPAVRLAIADLYLLACAGHLIGPHFSSFIEMAQALAPDSVAVESSRTPQVDGVDVEAAGLANDPLTPYVRSRL